MFGHGPKTVPRSLAEWRGQGEGSCRGVMPGAPQHLQHHKHPPMALTARSLQGAGLGYPKHRQRNPPAPFSAPRPRCSPSERISPGGSLAAPSCWDLMVQVSKHSRDFCKLPRSRAGSGTPPRARAVPRGPGSPRSPAWAPPRCRGHLPAAQPCHGVSAQVVLPPCAPPPMPARWETAANLPHPAPRRHPSSPPGCRRGSAARLPHPKRHHPGSVQRDIPSPCPRAPRPRRPAVGSRFT